MKRPTSHSVTALRHQTLHLSAIVLGILFVIGQVTDLSLVSAATVHRYSVCVLGDLFDKCSCCRFLLTLQNTRKWCQVSHGVVLHLRLTLLLAD